MSSGLQRKFFVETGQNIDLAVLARTVFRL